MQMGITRPLYPAGVVITKQRSLGTCIVIVQRAFYPLYNIIFVFSNKNLNFLPYSIIRFYSYILFVMSGKDEALFFSILGVGRTLQNYARRYGIHRWSLHFKKYL